MFNHSNIKLHQLVHQILRLIRQDPSYIIRFNHPISSNRWDRNKKLIGWIASVHKINRIIIRNEDHKDEQVKIVERPVVEYVLRSQFRYQIGFISDTGIDGWLQAKTQTTIEIEMTFEDGHREITPYKIEDYSEQRTKKFARYSALLCCPNCRNSLLMEANEFRCLGCNHTYPIKHGMVDFIDVESQKLLSLDETENISEWNYDPRIQQLIVDNPKNLYLDCGAGLRSTMLPNVINYEIVNYSTTDVRGIAEKLPFADQSLDGVFSVAVLEHVKNPQQCASEISRVLKSGGVLFCAVPFLQPVHAYPHHYFNMTAEGLRSLFPKFNIIEHNVPDSLHPIESLRWILYAYSSGLPMKERKKFEKMSVEEIFLLPSWNEPAHKSIPIIQNLSAEKRFEIAFGTSLMARKP